MKDKILLLSLIPIIIILVIPFIYNIFNPEYTTMQIFIKFWYIWVIVILYLIIIQKYDK